MSTHSTVPHSIVQHSIATSLQWAEGLPGSAKLSAPMTPKEMYSPVDSRLEAQIVRFGDTSVFFSCDGME